MAKQRRVIITGVSSGIDRATAIRFAREGYRVCLNARREALLKELADCLPPGDHLACPGDYSDRGAVEAVVETIRRSRGGVDVLVNSADILDRTLRGWCACFRHGHPNRVFHQLGGYLRHRLRQHPRRRGQRRYRPPSNEDPCAHLRLGT
jgi:NAD(P)-dependent dehydrogenase (short-subunit alcohol dehydrogenase family)